MSAIQSLDSFLKTINKQSKRLSFDVIDHHIEIKNITVNRRLQVVTKFEEWLHSAIQNPNNIPQSIAKPYSYTYSF